MLVAFLTIWMRWVCLWTTNSEVQPLCRRFKACDRWKKWKRPEKPIDKWMLYHNNGPCHTSLTIQHFLMTNQIPTIPQPLHSPDFTLCNFWLLLTTRLASKVIALYPKKKFNRAWEQVSQLYHEDFQLSFPQWHQSRKRVCAEQAYFDNNQHPIYYKLCPSYRNFLFFHV